MTEPEGQPPQVPYAPVDPAVRPLVLLADSRLLFQPLRHGLLLARLVAALPTAAPRAAYVGASSGDDPAFYALFEAAMEAVGIARCRQIPTDLEADDHDWLDRAHLILLSGGDPVRGWHALVDNGVRRIVTRRHREGALVIGVSAGAVQLGLGLLGEPATGGEAAEPSKLRTFGLVPHLVGAHVEADDWAGLARAVTAFGGHTLGYGLPFGAGLVVRPDLTLEPVGKPITELRRANGTLHRQLLVPADDGRLAEA